MKFIEPSVEYWKQDEGLEGVWKQIARATRVCYQSTPKSNGESDEDFVKRVILKPALIKGDLNDLEHCEFDFDKGHFSVLEHGTLYLTIPEADEDANSLIETLLNEDSSKAQHVCVGREYYVTTNLRYILEHHMIGVYHDYCAYYPTNYHKRRYTFSIISNIGVTRELNRHRVNSPSEESTRWCSYSAGKFGSEISYAYQPWMSEDYNKAVELLNNLSKEQQFTIFKDWCRDISNRDINVTGTSLWDKTSYLMFGLLAAEFSYLGMKSQHVTNDEARTVLNLGTKTQEVVTAFGDDWKHFLKLRADNASGKVHPDMQIIANGIKQLIQENNLI